MHAISPFHVAMFILCVPVERVERLIYRVSRESRSVIFALEDLSGVKPPANALGPHEEFIGPVADESAIRFFLVYNWRLKIFHYVLDETSAVADELVRAGGTDRILIGRRTSFAFYRDHRLDRRILIGVYEGNSRLNTYFDGPFDQWNEAAKMSRPPTVTGLLAKARVRN